MPERQSALGIELSEACNGQSRDRKGAGQNQEDDQKSVGPCEFQGGSEFRLVTHLLGMCGEFRASTVGARAEISHEASVDRPTKAIAMSDPLAYFITFHTYGTWLHGDSRGSVDRHQNVFGTNVLPEKPGMRTFEQTKLTRCPVRLNSGQRKLVAAAIGEVVKHRVWTLHALSVRSNHVHLVIHAEEPPGLVMNMIKSWTTRKLRGQGLVDKRQRVWTRHGSTRYLWKPHHVLGACQYVAEGQGHELT